MAEAVNPVTGPLQAGTTLQGRYVIERLLGGGGMGMVYLARDRRLANRPCALKEMVDHFIDQAQRIEANEYFAREADTLAQLKHQAIPAITDRFDDKNRHYLVMEYVEGRNLEEEMAARGGRLPEGLVIDIARQLCDVLAYLHGHDPSVIYRDMKPSNVMLTPKGRVVLIDFGIARLFKGARKGTMIGTLGFAPPEQYQGNVDPRSDIYSLGATLHYGLTNRDPEKFPPFAFPKIRELRPDVSSNLAGAIDLALSYDANARPASVQQFRDMMLYGTGLPASGNLAVSSRSGTADLALMGQDFPQTAILRPRKPKSAARRAASFLIFCIVLAGIAFGSTYIYSDPHLQDRLGIRAYIDQLPWKHEEAVAKARIHPLDFQQVTLALSTREGTPISAPQSSFVDTDLNTAQYLKWTATFRNELAGLEGQSEKVEARLFDPHGLQISSPSEAQLFVGPSQKTVDFAGVALMPATADKPAGQYKIALYSNNELIGEGRFAVTQDLTAHKKAEAEAAAEKTDEEKRAEEARKLAMIDERRHKPLLLRQVEFLNTTKSGTPLSGATSSFDVSKVLFVGWQVTFENRLFGLEPSAYQVDAAYYRPDGQILGSVNDRQDVSANQKTATFSGRVGNSSGGAFLPGIYTVNFYLNGQLFSQKKFTVSGSSASYPPSGGGVTGGYGAYTGGGGGGSSLGGGGSSFGGGLSSTGPDAFGATVANGSITGLPGGGHPNLELRLRPQPNGFLHGEMVIHKDGFGTTSIEGFVRNSHYQFQVPYGSDTYYFEGSQSGSTLSGTFDSSPSGSHGTWTAQASF